MAGPVKTRLACDRCHGQKLRCPKQPGSRVCTRCEKAGTLCIFSPVGRNGGVDGGGGTTVNVHNHLENGMGFSFGSTIGGLDDISPLADMPMSNGWPAPFDNGRGKDANGMGDSSSGIADFNFDDLMQMASGDSLVSDNLLPGQAVSNGGAPHAAGDTLATSTSTTTAAAAPSLDPRSGIEKSSNSCNSNRTGISPPVVSQLSPSQTLAQRLSRLAVDADILFTALPAESSMHASQDTLLEFLREDSAGKFAKQELFESVLDITQRLSSAYADAEHCVVISPPTPCEMPGCLHTTALPGDLQSIEEAFLASGLGGRARKKARLDLAIPNLLVAGHMRLLDSLVRITQGVFYCYKVRIATETLDEAEMHLPDLRVGSFIPTKDSAALMHAFLLRHLLNSLLERAETFAETLEKNISAPAAAPEEASGVNSEEPAAEPSPTNGPQTPAANRELQVAKLQLEILIDRHRITLHHLEAVGTDLAKLGMIK